MDSAGIFLSNGASEETKLSLTSLRSSQTPSETNKSHNWLLFAVKLCLKNDALITIPKLVMEQTSQKQLHVTKFINMVKHGLQKTIKNVKYTNYFIHRDFVIYDI